MSTEDEIAMNTQFGKSSVVELTQVRFFGCFFFLIIYNEINRVDRTVQSGIWNKKATLDRLIIEWSRPFGLKIDDL